MAPHEAAIAFELDVDEVEAGIRDVDRYVKPRLVEAVEVTTLAIARRARMEHGYQDRTGELTKSIRSLGARAVGDMVEGEVIADAPHAAPQEFGARPHVIRARNAKALRFFSGSAMFGEAVFRQSVNHPGNPEQRFLGDALDAEMDDTVDRIAKFGVDGFREAGFY